MEPKPHPRPLLWYGGNSAPSRELAADLADGWLTVGGGIDDVRAKLRDMDERLKRRGRARLRCGVLMDPVFVRESDEEAQKAAGRLLGEAGLKRVLQTGLVGSPETVIERLEAYARLGVDQLILRFSPGLEELERFARYVLPHVQSHPVKP